MAKRKLNPRYGGYEPYEGREDDLQIACFTWLMVQYPRVLAFHVPNGGNRSKREGGRFKAMGVLAGVPDILIVTAKWATATEDLPLSYGYGLAVELKVKGKTTSEAQEKTIERFKGAGWKVNIVWSFDQFKDVVNEYLSNGSK